MENTKVDCEDSWASLKQWGIPPVAAGLAIVPPYFGYMAKSELQLNNKVPKFSLVPVFKRSIQAMLPIGGIVGTQMVVQGGFEKLWVKFSGHEVKPTFTVMVISSGFVGVASVVPLAWFNGQTMNLTFMQTMKRLSFKQAGAIVTRESSFLGAIRVSDHVRDLMQQKFGEKKIVAVASDFFTGFLGSALGYPADTALTRWQNNLKVEIGPAVMKGVGIKSVASGIFLVLFKLNVSLFESFMKPQ